MLNGNTDGIKKVTLTRLERLEEIKSHTFADPEIVAEIAAFTAKTGREVHVSISRGGQLTDIAVGDAGSVKHTAFPPRDGRLNGVRMVHTHPASVTAALSDMDVSALLNSRSDASAVLAVGDDGSINDIAVAYFDNGKVDTVKSADLQEQFLLDKIIECEQAYRNAKSSTVSVADGAERAILVAVSCSGEHTKDDLKELAELAKTAGADIVADMFWSNPMPVGATMLGSGKVAELFALIQLNAATLVIFDNELSGIQVKNLEATLGVKVLDRSVLILDIFAMRAKSTEGKLQVELAQLKYNLPRLIGSGGLLSKMRSGIGMRGPGEKKLEVDRRRIKTQVTELENRLEQVKRERDLRRERRVSAQVLSVALVGYTNAGKSTLMNAMSKSDVYVADKLFATLDPVTRSVRLDDKNSYLLTDTVGFVNKLPHQFIQAFSSTLEEAVHADLLLIVSDVTDPRLTEKNKVVEDVLKLIGADAHPKIYVYNKTDKRDKTGEAFVPPQQNAVEISAKTGENLGVLKAKIGQMLSLTGRIKPIKTE